jgi:hypothetical protein
VQSELAAIDKRLAILGDGDLSDVYIAHRHDLRTRREHSNERLPYRGISDEQLASQVEDTAIEVEQLTTQLSKLPRIKGDWTDSKEALKLKRTLDETVERKVRAEQEARYRLEKHHNQVGVETMAQRQAEELAAKAWRSSLDTQMAEMAENGAPKWEIQKVREESGGAPPAELVEQFAADIKQEFIDQHPSVDPNVSI